MSQASAEPSNQEPPAVDRPRPRGLAPKLALSAISIAGGTFLCMTLVALVLGAWHLLAAGVGALLVLTSLGTLAWARTKRPRQAAGIVFGLGLSLSLPFVLPIPDTVRTGALIQSRSIHGGTGGTPWFTGIPERELVEAGARVGLARREKKNWFQAGGWQQTYLPGTQEDLFVHSESLVLDSWLFDRGHYWVASPVRNVWGRSNQPAAEKRLPLLVFLHGNGGNFQPYAHWLGPPAVEREIVAVFPTYGFGIWSLPKALERIDAVIDHVEKEHPIDRNRIVLAGLSAGGMGVIRVLEAAPGRFKGGVTISGAPRRSVDGSALSQTPLLMLHGRLDGHVGVGTSRTTAETVRVAGGQVRYIEYPDEDHTLLMLHREELVKLIFDWVEERLR